MYFNVAVWQIPWDQPGVFVITLKIQVYKAQGAKIGNPDIVFIDNNVQGQRESTPLIDKFHLCRVIGGMEHVDATTGAIQRKNASARANAQGMDTLELTRASTLAAEFRQVVQILVQNDDPVIVALC